jgi:DNA mismatch repair protein MutL
MPLTFTINQKIDKKIEKLQKIWFDISYFWENKVILYSIPKVLEKYKIDIAWLINNLLYSKNDDLTIQKILDQVFATKSCKIAIKANHKLSILEMRQLIKDWMKYIDGFFVCQHWRESVVRLSKENIDKLFGRK